MHPNSSSPVPPARPHVLHMVQLSHAALTALAAGDLDGASAAAGVELTNYFVTDGTQGLWRRRLRQIASDPTAEGWIARAVVADPAGVVVGHAGYHGPPDDDGMVEVAYSVDPAHRRQGYARAMLRELLRRAGAEPAVTTVRATISPDNAASLATIRGMGFVQTGEQWDGDDGLELVFETPART